MFSDYSLSSINSEVPFESTEMLDRSIPVKLNTEKKSGFLSSFQRPKQPQTDVTRVIPVLLPSNQKFLGNHVSTAKYNPVTFLPKFLYVEFSKSANLFFLFISGIQVRISFLLLLKMMN